MKTAETRAFDALVDLEGMELQVWDEEAQDDAWNQDAIEALRPHFERAMTEARREALEEAAAIATRCARTASEDGWPDGATHADEMAAEIRAALADKEPVWVAPAEDAAS